MNTSIVPTRQSSRFASLVASGSTSYIVCFCAALVFAGLAVRDVLRQHQSELNVSRGTIVSSINASALLLGRHQFLGDGKAPYTLVEFGDYECPPCRHTQSLVAYALHKYSGRIKLDFRQLPLTQIHPHAEAAALAAESGRPDGKFWTLHEQLYKANLSRKGAIAHILASAGVVLNRGMARKQMIADAALEKRLSVSSTPSFFLCCPDGSVFRLPHIESIDLIVK